MAENAVISKGTKLSYKNGEAFVALTNLQELADLGGDVDSIEITTLDDAAHKYTGGIKNYGDSLQFKFLYEKAQFAALDKLAGEVEWKVELPDGATCTFGGSCSVKLDKVGINAAFTYTLSIKPSSEFAWA